MTRVVEVRLWGRTIGAAVKPPGQVAASFEYDADFQRSGIELSPLHMPLGPTIYQFPALPQAAFKGLPGLLADSLPDRFGNDVIDAWLSRTGRDPASFGALERLCYLGRRGMGALTFHPAEGPEADADERLEIAELVELASDILASRGQLRAAFRDDPGPGLATILQVGTSAGGARAKALIGWNEATGEVRSGQLDLPEGFGYWLLKFDGVSGNGDRGLADPKGYGTIEYAYHRLAVAAGIEMTSCRLLEEGGRRHFMTRRFDRTPRGRLHLQSLGALDHLDYNQPGTASYERAFDVMRHLDLPMEDLEQQFRRMVFNLVARNQDDHVKNIAFLMDRAGRWRLSPAYDVTWSYNPAGAFTSRHQMTVNGRREGFEAGDLEATSRHAGLPRSRWRRILSEVVDAVSTWPEVAADLGVSPDRIEAIAETHRLAW